jgi:hypothetical protein
MSRVARATSMSSTFQPNSDGQGHTGGGEATDRMGPIVLSVTCLVTRDEDARSESENLLFRG